MAIIGNNCIGNKIHKSKMRALIMGIQELLAMSIGDTPPGINYQI